MTRMTKFGGPALRCSTALLACAAGLALAPSHAAAASAALALQAPATPRAHSVVPVDVRWTNAPAPLQAGGKRHLLYELRLNNFSSRKLVLDRIDILDAADARVLGSYESGELAAMLRTPGAKPEGEAPTLNGNGLGILFLDVALPLDASVPKALVHRLRFKSDKADAPESRTTIVTAPMQIGDSRAAVLGAPLRGSGWLAANALANDGDHRRTISVVDGLARIGQRYAIDFVQLDGEGRAFTGDPSINANWTGYGADVLAVADGTVEAVQDGQPDNPPGQSPAQVTLETIGGNNLVLDIGGGRRVYFGHLKPGSISVRVGQSVRKGQVIGKVGNSGQSDAAHLHIHVADSGSPLGAEGLPYVFERYTLEGYVPSLQILESAGGWQKDPSTLRQKQANEMPLANAVVSFDK